MHRSFYRSFTQRSFYTEKPLHTTSFKKIIHRSIYTHTHKSFTHTPLRTELLHTDAFTRRSLFTEQGLHRAAFTHQSFYTERGLCTEQLLQSYTRRGTETLNTQMPKLLRRQVFTHRGIYTKVLHTDAADASTHRSF